MIIKRTVKGYDSRAIANFFVEKALQAEKPLDIMSLIKFVYIAHGWHLAYADKPLIYHPVEVWKRGPVIPQIYRIFRSQQGVVIKGYAISPYGYPYYVILRNDKQARETIDFVYTNYSHLNPWQLSDVTHRTGTPWDQMKDKGFYTRIPNDVIKGYYEKYLDEE